MKMIHVLNDGRTINDLTNFNVRYEPNKGVYDDLKKQIKRNNDRKD